MELPDVRIAEKEFGGIIYAAAARLIPADRIPEVRPKFRADATGLAYEHGDIRRDDPNDPRIGKLNSEIDRKVGEYKRKIWLNHTKQYSLGSGIGKLWAPVKSLSNPARRDGRLESYLVELQ